MTNELINLIKHYEGFDRTPRKDGSGYAIGFGNHYYEDKSPVKENDPAIDVQRAEKILDASLNRVSNVVAQLVDRNKLTTPQFEALVSLKYNCYGVNSDSTIIKVINQNPNDSRIKGLFGEWRLAGGKVKQGLVNRRNSEYTYYSTGKLDFTPTAISVRQESKNHTEPTPSDAVSSESTTQIKYYNTNYCGALSCDDVNKNEDSDNGNYKETGTPEKSKTQKSDYVTELQQRLSKAVLLKEKDFIFREISYDKQLTGGNGYQMKCDILEPLKDTNQPQKLGEMYIQIIPKPNRYKVYFKKTNISNQRKEYIDAFNEIMDGTDIVGKDYNEALNMFESYFGDRISNDLYTHFKGKRYERINKSDLSGINDYHPGYSKSNLIKHMNRRSLFLVYIPDMQRVILRCDRGSVEKDELITFNVESNNGAFGWNGFRILSKGDNV